MAGNLIHDDIIDKIGKGDNYCCYVYSFVSIFDYVL